MSVVQSFNSFKKCMAQRLKSQGFMVAGGVFLKRVNDTVVILEIQKDRKRRTNDEVSFTINVGIFVEALRVTVFGDAQTEEVPLPEKCHWRQRLGRLLTAQADLWWSVRDETTARSLCNEIANGLIEQALPKVYEVASSGALLRLWHEERGQGLTEFERRSNLAALLLLLKRMDDARAAIEALEIESRGRPWEASARYTATQLRKYLPATA